MPTTRKKLKKGDQLDMLAVFDKPFEDHETLYKNLLSELKNIKYIRANSQYVDFNKEFKLTLWQNYSAILSCLSDILSGLAVDTRKYRHNDRAFYDNLSVDPDYLSCTEILSREDIYFFTRKAQGRIIGLIVANTNMLADFSAPIKTIEGTLASSINKIYLHL